MIKGNKGEWSEIYVLLKLLSEGRIYAADKDLNKIEDLYFPILKIIREETPAVRYDYILEDATVRIALDNKLVGEYKKGEFSQEALNLFQVIVSAGSGTFSVKDTEVFMEKIKCKKLKPPPPSSGTSKLSKSDITMQVHDPKTSHEPINGFSIKSELGHAPTLLNAGKTTNFIYRIDGLSDTDIAEINAIETKNKIIDRINAIRGRSSDLHFERVANKVFESNLQVVDTMLPKLLSDALVYFYKDRLSTCLSAVSRLTEENPLRVGSPSSYYATKFKKFLVAVALGMVPSIVWDGKDEAMGGYIVAKRDGNVLAYHIYNRDSFEEYLLHNTKFESASTERHKYACIYKENGCAYINLNLQIRFV